MIDLKEIRGMVQQRRAPENFHIFYGSAFPDQVEHWKALASQGG